MSTTLEHSKGQTVTVPDDAAEYYLSKGWKPAGATTETRPEDAVEIPDGVPTEAWKVPQIDAYAEREGIDLGDATKKPEKLAAIATALEKKEAAGGTDSGEGSSVPDAGAGS